MTEWYTHHQSEGKHPDELHKELLVLVKETLAATPERKALLNEMIKGYQLPVRVSLFFPSPTTGPLAGITLGVGADTFTGKLSIQAARVPTPQQEEAIAQLLTQWVAKQPQCQQLSQEIINTKAQLEEAVKNVKPAAIAIDAEIDKVRALRGQITQDEIDKIATAIARCPLGKAYYPLQHIVFVKAALHKELQLRLRTLIAAKLYSAVQTLSLPEPIWRMAEKYTLKLHKLPHKLTDDE
jgi:hypothetical protein